jgi:hypothetical protein
MNCQHLENNHCRLASELAQQPVVPAADACKFCTDQCNPPRAINEVIVSLALVALRSRRDAAGWQRVFNEHHHRLQSAGFAKPFCQHLADVVRTVPGDWLDCHCGSVPVHRCAHFGEFTVPRSLSEDAAKIVGNIVEGYAGRSCVGCAVRKTTPGLTPGVRQNDTPGLKVRHWPGRHFPHVLVINLRRRPDRWAEFLRSIPEDWPFGKPIQFDAIDGRGNGFLHGAGAVLDAIH